MLTRHLLLLAPRRQELAINLQTPQGAQTLLEKYPPEHVEGAMLKYVAEGRAAMGQPILKVPISGPTCPGTLPTACRCGSCRTCESADWGGVCMQLMLMASVQVMEAQYAQGLLHPTIAMAHPQGGCSNLFTSVYILLVASRMRHAVCSSVCLCDKPKLECHSHVHYRE